jgi:hypothetical protein
VSATVNGARGFSFSSNNYDPVVFTSCRDAASVIMTEARAGNELANFMQTILSFSINDSSSDDPWVVPSVLLGKDERIDLSDGNVIDSNLASTILLKVSSSPDGKTALLAGFLTSVGERAWGEVRSLDKFPTRDFKFARRETRFYIRDWR